MNNSPDDTNNMTWQDELLNSIEVGIVVLDANYTVESWNQFMQNHSGLAPKDIVGQPVFKHFQDLDEAWFRRKCEPAFTLHTPVFIVWEQRPYVFKFGTNRPITSASDNMYQNVTIFPLTANAQGASKICMMIYDVTDQAINQQQLDAAKTRLLDISRIDGLTSLHNRRYWQERFEAEYKLGVRNDVPVTLIMLDIDHFKKVNDEHGHPAGDRVIQMLSLLIKKATRTTDITGRYGGEEFAIILPNTDTKSAAIVAERLRRVVEKSTVKCNDVALKFTISIGIAQLSADYTSANMWLQAADVALYKAKQTGRNKLVFRT